MFTASKKLIPVNVTAIFFLTILTTLASCGFALRGNIEIPVEAQSFWLEFNNASHPVFMQEFGLLVEQNNLDLNETADNRIVITRLNIRKITTTINAAAEVDEYTLRGELSFDIVGLEEEPLATNLEAFSERTFQYDANDAAASNSREAFLKRELLRDLSEQVIRQYAARVRIR